MPPDVPNQFERYTAVTSGDVSVRNPCMEENPAQTPIWRFVCKKVVIRPTAMPFQEIYQEDMRPLYIRPCRCDGLFVGHAFLKVASKS